MPPALNKFNPWAECRFCSSRLVCLTMPTIRLWTTTGHWPITVISFWHLNWGRCLLRSVAFMPAGVYSELLKIPQCVGAKHSSLNRQLEWDRLVIRNEQRPEFKVLTGNDLAIDMVMYGSDYLLGLSTFAPDLFARRDRFWLDGDPRFYELNDVLQYLGFFAFREPTSAYKHSAAMFLKMRGWIPCDATHPDSPGRPGGDIAVLAEIGQRLGLEMKE